MRCGLVAVFLISAAMAAAPATGPSPATVEKLKQRALGEDVADSSSALAELTSLSNEAARTVAGQLLVKDKQRIDAAAAALGDGSALKALEQQIADVRKSAAANLQKLAKDQTLVVAREHHTRLSALLKKLNALYAHRALLIDLPQRRADLHTILKLPATLPSDSAIIATAEKALGQSIAEARAAAEFSGGRPPRDPAARSFWLYRAARQIDAYNRTFLGPLNAKEIEEIRIINAYREMLGVLPMEIDLRLAQAARRHSKEMVDLKYFAHNSPTEDFVSPADRMRQAGYDPGFGYSENIAEFVRDPQMLFDAWFKSPGHHLGFIGGHLATVGLGKWDHTWTLDMSDNQRLMGTPNPKDRMIIKGPVLAAQDLKVDEGKPPRREVTETRIYDPRNPDPNKRKIVEREVRD